MLQLLDGLHASLAERAEHGVGPGQEHQRHVEQHAEDETDRDVAGEERGHQPDGQHRQAHEPVADVSAQEQAEIEVRRQRIRAPLLARLFSTR